MFVPLMTKRAPHKCVMIFTREEKSRELSSLKKPISHQSQHLDRIRDQGVVNADLILASLT